MDGGGLDCTSEEVVRPRLALHPGLEVVDATHPRRAEAEAFIAARYQLSYGAQVTRFMPNLLIMPGADGEILATAGIRLAADGQLFSEQYLDEPVESVLSQRFGSSVSRFDIAEIGQLSGIGNGAGRRLFPLIALHLQSLGVSWALFVATGRLRSLFERIELRPMALAPATAERVGDAAASWGSYYDHDPWVIGGPMVLGRHLLESLS